MKVSKLAVRTYTPEKQQPTDMGTNSPLNMALRPYPTSVPLAGQAQRAPHTGNPRDSTLYCSYRWRITVYTEISR